LDRERTEYDRVPQSLGVFGADGEGGKDRAGVNRYVLSGLFWAREIV
jgi:hypothetical protein